MTLRRHISTLSFVTIVTMTMICMPLTRSYARARPETYVERHRNSLTAIALPACEEIRSTSRFLEPVHRYDTSGISGFIPGPLVPWDTSGGPGDIVIADTANATVYRIGIDGSSEALLGFGRGPGELSSVVAIDVTEHGFVVVGSLSPGLKALWFDRAGDFERESPPITADSESVQVVAHMLCMSPWLPMAIVDSELVHFTVGSSNAFEQADAIVAFDLAMEDPLPSYSTIRRYAQQSTFDIEYIPPPIVFARSGTRLIAANPVQRYILAVEATTGEMVTGLNITSRGAPAPEPLPKHFERGTPARQLLRSMTATNDGTVLYGGSLRQMDGSGWQWARIDIVSLPRTRYIASVYIRAIPDHMHVADGILYVSDAGRGIVDAYDLRSVIGSE